VLAEDAILLDKTRAVLWHNYKNYTWQKEKGKKQKNEKQNEMKATHALQEPLASCT